MLCTASSLLGVGVEYETEKARQRAHGAPGGHHCNLLRLGCVRCRKAFGGQAQPRNLNLVKGAFLRKGRHNNRKAAVREWGAPASRCTADQLSGSSLE